MSTPEGACGSAPSDKVHLLVDLGSCLAGWQQALAQRMPPVDPNVVRLRGSSAGLQSRLPSVGFGGIAFHLGELVRRFESGGAAGNPNESLEALFHMAEQARLTLAPQEQAVFAQASSMARQGVAPPAVPAMVAPAPSPGSLAPAPPPMLLTGFGAVEVEPRRAAVEGGASSGPSSVQPPRLIDSMIVQGGGPAGRAGALPSFGAPGAGLPVPGPVPAAGAVAPQFGVVAPVAVPFGAADAVNPLAPAKPAKSPNLMVRSMLGLRPLLGRQPQAGGVSVPPKDAASQSGERRSSLLGLRRGQSSPGISVPPPPESGGRKSLLFSLKRSMISLGLAASPSAPPPLLDRGPSGLPPLPPTPSTPPRNDIRSSAAGESASAARNLQELMGGIDRSRGGRRADAARGRPALLRQRQEEGHGWRIVGIAGAIIALVFGGLVTLIVVLTRPDEESRRSQIASGAASVSSARGATPASSGDLPRSRLQDDNESFRALLTQVHGRGKESAQLRALVDEQAAVAARAVSSQKCEGSAAECQALAKLRESVLGGEGAKRITRRRAAGSPDRVRSRWLVGLKLPEIPIEDDPRVQRWFEYYSEGAVGRELFQAMLFRCGAYRDLIQATLIRYGLPADILAVVFVESGCEPQATSPVGAAGLWQFMPAVARAYHLQVKEGVIDERRSPPKSTDAAVRFLRDMRDKLAAYQSQGVWDLVFASYNAGPFGMITRLEQAGGDVGFWDLVDADQLPDETAQYVPTIQAVALILNNLQRLKFTGVQMRSPQITSDLEVPPGTRLSLVARAASTSVIQLRSLNLDISGETTPDVPSFAVQVPKDVVWQARDTLKELMARQDNSDQCMPPDFDWGRQRLSKEQAEACRRRLGASPSPPPQPSR